MPVILCHPVFPAGRRKTIRPGAVVAWHGNDIHLVQTGLWRDDSTVRWERLGEDETTALLHAREDAERHARLEQEFSAHIGANEYLCWIGKQPPYSAPNYYFLSTQEMARVGVTQVSTCAGLCRHGRLRCRPAHHVCRFAAAARPATGRTGKRPGTGTG